MDGLAPPLDVDLVDGRSLPMTIEAEIAAGLHSVEIEHELHKFAEKVRDYARDLAPVFGETGRDDRRTAPPEGAPGDFRESIKVRTTGKPGHLRVGSNSPIALWQEVGTRHFPEDAIFAKTAKYFGGTGPIIDEGVQHAQGRLRGELERLEKLAAAGAGAHHIAAQRRAVEQARTARSAAFKAARGRGRRGRR
ncbi:hypothetical protein DKM27_24685 [Mycobacterium tuberculosis variant bovis]|nr:hypothetical protein CKJ72_03800 [Mycobacterium avium]TXA39609.1 hypothetical protein DKM27_24685 [Mycobacterium tuberculosis variant bovis]